MCREAIQSHFIKILLSNKRYVGNLNYTIYIMMKFGVTRQSFAFIVFSILAHSIGLFLSFSEFYKLQIYCIQIVQIFQTSMSVKLTSTPIRTFDIAKYLFQICQLRYIITFNTHNQKLEQGSASDMCTLQYYIFSTRFGVLFTPHKFCFGAAIEFSFFSHICINELNSIPRSHVSVLIVFPNILIQKRAFQSFTHALVIIKILWSLQSKNDEIRQINNFCNTNNQKNCKTNNFRLQTRKTKNMDLAVDAMHR